MKIKAYDINLLLSKYTFEKSKIWFQEKQINVDQLEQINQQLKPRYLDQNIFAQTGMFLFTLGMISSSLSLFFWFLLIMQLEYGKTGILICSFISMITIFIVLEKSLLNKKYFRSGVDNALLFCGLYSIIMFINIMIDDQFSDLMLSIFISVIVHIFITIRYANRYICVSGLLSFYYLIYQLMIINPITKVLLPFIMMIISILIFFIVNSNQSKISFYYLKCLNLIKLFSVGVFYLAGNYLVVRELNALMLGSINSISQEISFSYLFWFFTFSIPVLIIYLALKNRKKYFLWLGLLSLGFSIFTFRYYYQVMPIEYAMFFGGIILIVFSIFVIQYLKKNPGKITFVEDNSDENQNWESQIISSTIAHQSAQTKSDFGQGDFGGGGAGGQY